MLLRARFSHALAALLMLLLPAEASAKLLRHTIISTGVQTMAPLPSHLPADVTRAITENHWAAARTGLEQMVANGDAEAKGTLGMLLLRGVDGAAPDIEQGRKLLERAAFQGDTQAQRNLAQLFFLGGFSNGTPQYSEAYKYVDPLATNRDPIGMYYASKYFLEGLLGVRNVNVGLQLLKDSAQAGARNAQYDLALLYRRGLPGSVPDPKSAVFWFEQAAKHNHANAAYETGMAYLVGIGTTQDTNKAIPWLDTSVKLGNANAAVALAKLYQTGRSVPLNIEKAKSLYLFAANAHVGPAYAELSDIVGDLKLGTPDPVQSLSYALSGKLLGSKKSEDQVIKLRGELSALQTAEGVQRFEAWKKSQNIIETKPRISTLVDTQ